MIRCTLYGSPVAMDTNVTMISDVCPAHPACALPWGCAVDVAVSGPARRGVRPLNPSVLWYVYTLQPGAPSCRSENAYTARHALDRQPCTASDSAHAVGRPLQVAS